MSEIFMIEFILILQMVPTVIFAFTGLIIAPFCVYIIVISLLNKRNCKEELTRLWLATAGIWFIGIVSFIVLIILTGFTYAFDSLSISFISLMFGLTIVMAGGSGIVARIWCWTNSEVKNEGVKIILNLVDTTLRRVVFNDPKREKDISDSLEGIFIAKELDYQREAVTIGYSSKTFIPDFTFETWNLALEVKLCNSSQKEKDIIDQMNADIPAYQTKYKQVVFVVYDQGFIRDVQQFKSSFEQNEGVYISVTKR